MSVHLSAELIVNEDSIKNSTFSSQIDLGEVIIETKPKNINSRGIGNIQVNMRQLRISPLFLGERDIIKTLQFLPGVSAGMEGSSQLNIRGGTNDQTLYLMDDVPVYNQNHTFGFLSIFNSNAISSVDIYKGGIPTQYGDKLSGVVNVSLKEGDFKKHSNSVTLGVIAGTVSSDGPIIKDKLSYLITGRHSTIDLLYNGIAELSGMSSGGTVMLSFYDLNGKLTWKLNEKNKLSWQFFSGYDDLHVINKGRNDYEKLKYFDKYSFGWKTTMSSLRYTSQLKTNVSLSSSIYYTALKNFNNYKHKTEIQELKQESKNEQASLIDEFGVKVSLTHEINENNTLNYGLDAVHQIYTPDIIFQQTDGNKMKYNPDHLKLNKMSLYVYDELKYEQWLLSLGIRSSLYNNFTSTKFSIEPRIKINTYLGEKNKLMLAYDRMVQPVHSINEMNYHIQSDYWIPFKEIILPQSNHFSLGWKNYTNSNLNFLAEIYYKTINNLLHIKNFEYYLDYHIDYEQGKGDSKGAEFMVEYAKDRFSSCISYTLSKSLRRFEGKTFPFKYDSPNNLAAQASYVTRKTDKTIHTSSLSMQYRNGYPYYVSEISYSGMGLPTLHDGYRLLDDLSTVDLFPKYPNIRIKDYFRLDANYTVEKKMKRGSLTWQFSLLNASNHKNPYTVYKKDGKYKAFVLIPVFPSLSVTRDF